MEEARSQTVNYPGIDVRIDKDTVLPFEIYILVKEKSYEHEDKFLKLIGIYFVNVKILAVNFLRD